MPHDGHPPEMDCEESIVVLVSEVSEERRRLGDL